MFGKSIRLFNLFGFEVKIDASWLIIALLVTFTLARGVFPGLYKGLPAAAYWWMGIAGAAGLFISIIIHEFFHSLVARRYGLPMKGITLFVFGGVAEMEDEPKRAGTEFLMAIAGPVSSVGLALAYYGLAALFRAFALPVALIGVTGYLAYINVILAVFNMVPAFPLDGGRVLRSALWKWKGDLRWATRIASAIGSAFGLVLIVLGIWDLFTGNLVGGIWLFLIGMFIRGASQMSYRQVLLRKMLEGETVRRFLREKPVSVPPGISVSELVEDYFYKYHFKMFPVSDEGALRGCIRMERVKDIPRDERKQRTVGEFVEQCTMENTVRSGETVLRALKLMSRTGNDKLMVVDDGALAGMVTRNDILRFFAAKIELGEGEEKE